MWLFLGELYKIIKAKKQDGINEFRENSQNNTIKEKTLRKKGKRKERTYISEMIHFFYALDFKNLDLV